MTSSLCAPGSALVDLMGLNPSAGAAPSEGHAQNAGVSLLDDELASLGKLGGEINKNSWLVNIKADVRLETKSEHAVPARMLTSASSPLLGLNENCVSQDTFQVRRQRTREVTVFSGLEDTTFFSRALNPASHTPMWLSYGCFWAKGEALSGSAKVKQTEEAMQRRRRWR